MTEKLNHILKTLSKRHRSRGDVFYDCVVARMNKSLETYEKEIEDTFNFLTRRNELRMMRKINRGVK